MEVFFFEARPPMESSRSNADAGLNYDTDERLAPRKRSCYEKQNVAAISRHGAKSTGGEDDNEDFVEGESDEDSEAVNTDLFRGLR